MPKRKSDEPDRDDNTRMFTMNQTMRAWDAKRDAKLAYEILKSNGHIISYDELLNKPEFVKLIISYQI